MAYVVFPDVNDRRKDLLIDECDANISSILIKLIANNISGPISTLINKSIMTGTVPEHMQIAKIIPIYKSKSKDDFSNYRPKSILPTISKILEKGNL